MALFIGVGFGAEVFLAARSGLYASRLQFTNGFTGWVELDVEEDFEVRVEHHRNGPARVFGLPLPVWPADIGQAGSWILKVFEIFLKVTKLLLMWKNITRLLLEKRPCWKVTVNEDFTKEGLKIPSFTFRFV